MPRHNEGSRSRKNTKSAEELVIKPIEGFPEDLAQMLARQGERSLTNAQAAFLKLSPERGADFIKTLREKVTKQTEAKALSAPLNAAADAVELKVNSAYGELPAKVQSRGGIHHSRLPDATWENANADRLKVHELREQMRRAETIEDKTKILEEMRAVADGYGKRVTSELVEAAKAKLNDLGLAPVEPKSASRRTGDRRRPRSVDAPKTDVDSASVPVPDAAVDVQDVSTDVAGLNPTAQRVFAGRTDLGQSAEPLQPTATADSLAPTGTSVEPQAKIEKKERKESWKTIENWFKKQDMTPEMREQIAKMSEEHTFSSNEVRRDLLEKLRQMKSSYVTEQIKALTTPQAVDPVTSTLNSDDEVFAPRPEHRPEPSISKGATAEGETGSKQEPLYWSKYDAQEELDAMYGGAMPVKVLNRYEEIADKIDATEEDSPERRSALAELQSFNLAQWEATRNNRANGANTDYAIWVQQLEKFEESQSNRRAKLEKALYSGGAFDSLPADIHVVLHEFDSSYIEALNAGDEVKMAEISAAAEAFVEGQRAKIGIQKNPTDTDATPSVLHFRSGHERSIPPFPRGNDEEQDVPDSPKGWKDKLRGLITKVVAETKEDVNWWKSSSEGLIRRSAELDAKAEHIGGIEGSFRKLGERYNKLNWKGKLAFGASLGLGVTAATATGAFPFAYALLLPIAAQRTAALSTMFLKFEKEQLDKHTGGKVKALGKAMAYTAVMGGAMLGVGALVREVSETSLGQRTIQGLKNLWPSSSHNTTVQVPAPQKVTPSGSWETNTVAPKASEVAPASIPQNLPGANSSAEQSEIIARLQAQGHNISADSSPEEMRAALEQTKSSLAEAKEQAEALAKKVAEVSEKVDSSGEMPSVGATKGKGSEYMMKRLWEQLHNAEHPFTPPANLDPKSDLAQLLGIQKGDEAGINQLVHKIAERHTFYHTDGTNARIDVGSIMSFDTNGDITIDGVYETPNDGPTTPAYRPETSVVPQPSAPVGPESIPYFEQPVENPVTGEPSPARVDPAGTGLNPTETGDDATNYSEKMPVTPPEVVPETPKINSHGVEVFTGKPHLYAGAKGEIFISGGTPAEQEIKIREHLKAHPKESIIGTNITNNPNKIRLRWFVNPEGYVACESAEPKGWFNLSKLTGAPKPEEFYKIIK